MKKSLVVIAGSLLVLSVLYASLQLFIPLPLGNRTIEFEIPQGATYRQVVEALASRGLVRDKWIIYLLGRTTGIDRRIKAGYYPLWGTMSPFEIFLAIREGRIIEYEITVVPGDSLREISDKFAVLTGVDQKDFDKACRDRGFLDSLDIEAPSLEGYLFPDTYRFPKGLDVEEILTLMVNRLREQYDEDILGRMLEMNLSERDMLILASIVEKEAVVDGERPVIAAVYFNRLRKGMPLQADPTAIYGVKASSEKITREDLIRKTPYNTYLIRGLPPGPIASPGLKSILATLEPAAVPYLYFVSNNDGTHRFSVTHDQHSEAVKVYREKKRLKG